MEARLQRWGNSDGIRIPKSLLKALNLKTNDIVDLIQEDNKIIISKSSKKKVSLRTLIKNYDGPNLAKDYNWDDKVGNEIW